MKETGEESAKEMAEKKAKSEVDKGIKVKPRKREIKEDAVMNSTVEVT